MSSLRTTAINEGLIPICKLYFAVWLCSGFCGSSIFQEKSQMHGEHTLPSPPPPHPQYALIQRELSSIYLVDEKWPKCFLPSLPLSFTSVASPLVTACPRLAPCTMSSMQPHLPTNTDACTLLAHNCS